MAAWPRFPGTIPPAASGRDSLDGMPDWGALRAEFPLLDRYVYFNACSLGPLPRSGRAALARYGQDWDEQGTPVRSEEHTSELQSRFDIVCRLLLEKKKHNSYVWYH